LDDGKVNCLSLPMLAELNRAFDQAQADDVVVVLTGREGMFCGGFDLATFKQGGEPVYRMLKEGAELVERVLRFPRPVVIACSGHAVAMGAFLTMSGDVRIGSQGSFKIVCNEVAIGLTMPRFAIELSRSRLTPSHFNRALINAEVFSPDGAVEAGFLDRVVPPLDLRAEAARTAEALAKLHPRAFAETKTLVHAEALERLHMAIETEMGSVSVFADTIGAAMSVG
jgi:enoyl-CoA hydratase